MTLQRKLLAEFIGTFWLVFGGCGAAIYAAAVPQLGIGFAGVSAAFGLTVLTMAYAVGPISGGHFNPAVSAGLATAGRLPWSDLVPYVLAQLAGAIIAAAVLYYIASGKTGFEVGGFASNGYGDHSPGGYSMVSAFVIEAILTGFFLLIILGATEARAAAGFAPITIGLALVLIHLISIPIDNTSVKSGTLHKPGIVRWQLGAAAAMAVLGRTYFWRGRSRRSASFAARRRYRAGKPSAGAKFWQRRTSRRFPHALLKGLG